MTVRQYIGARYVPIFIGEWDISKDYEPLSIVQYLGNSYTSRQAVPSGIAITNNEFWAETGNYNAQVEAYRNEVLALAANVDEKIENASMYVGVLDGKYALTLVQANGKNIVFDCGAAEDDILIDTFFNNDIDHHEVTRIDAVVITHFHEDHYSGFDTVANYCDADTDIFIQMAPTTVSPPDSAQNDYNIGKAFVESVALNHGLKTPVVPYEHSIYDYDGVKIEFMNTNPNNRSAYDNAFSNSSDVQSTRKQIRSLNNYSLIARVDYRGNSYVETGDIEGAAEIVYSDVIGSANVAKCPHHFANRMGVYNFFKNLNPDIWISTANFITPRTSIGQYSYMAGYLARFLMWENDTTPYLTNILGNVNIYLNNGCVHEFNGYECGLSNYNLDRMHYFMCLPPEYYNEYPFCLQNAALDSSDNEIPDTNVNLPILANTINDMAKQHGIRVFGLGYDANIPLSAQLYACYPGYSTGTQIYFTMGFALFEAQYMNAYHHAPVLKVEPGYTLSEPLKRIIRTSPGAFYYEANSFSTPGEINYGDWYFLRHANVLEVILDNGMSIPVTRNKIVDYGDSYTGLCFCGTAFNDAGTHIYYVNVKVTKDGNNVYHREMIANRVSMSDGTVTAMTVTTVGTVC